LQIYSWYMHAQLWIILLLVIRIYILTMHVNFDMLILPTLV